ncbi:hypothetical protein TWF281_002945 [Arthrobotrys megalospora]
MASQETPQAQEIPQEAPKQTDPSSVQKAVRRASGAGDYFRHTIMAKVEHLAGAAAKADEQEKLARKGYAQMRGRPEEHTHTPPVTEQQTGTTNTGATVEPGQPTLSTDSKA